MKKKIAMLLMILPLIAMLTHAQGTTFPLSQSQGATNYPQPSSQWTNLPNVYVTADYTKLPKGSWYYSFCTLPVNGSNGITNSVMPHTDQALYLLDDSLRPVFTLQTGVWGQLWQGFPVYWKDNDSLLGYNNNSFYYPNGVAGQASGVFPRYKLDPQKGFLKYDTLYGAGVANHPAPSLDTHGLYEGDSFYVAIQNYIFMGDTGFGLAMMSYQDSVIALYNSEDAIDGIPDNQSYQSSTCFSFAGSNGDYQHPNSIDAIGDSVFIVSLRHMDEIAAFKYNKQSHKFKKAWRLRPPNAPGNSFTWIGDTIGFSGQHNAVVTRAIGSRIDITVFDDADCSSARHSRFMYLILNLDSMTCTVSHKESLPFHTGFMGSSMVVPITSNTMKPPVLYASGGFDTTGIQETGVSNVGLLDFYGNQIGGVTFQPDTIKSQFNAYYLTYQARPYYIPAFDSIRPKVTTACSGDSMTITLDKHYDNVYWSTGQAGLSITLPRQDTVISVGVNNYPAVGQWWAYSYGCPAQQVFTGTNDIALIKIDLYPNPAHEAITLSGNIPAQTSYSIVSLDGQIVSSGTLKATNKQSVSLSGMSQGIYLLNFISANQQYAKKIVVY